MALLLALVSAAAAEPLQIGIARGAGFSFLPVYILEHERLVKDPEFDDDPVPAAQIFADFMSQTGTLKRRPATWQEPFLPPVHGLPGS
jgi:hypothetical protein